MLRVVRFAALGEQKMEGVDAETSRAKNCYLYARYCILAVEDNKYTNRYKMMDYTELQGVIEAAWSRRGTSRAALTEAEVVAVRASVAGLDTGELRVAEPVGAGWRVNEWVKMAILLYFGTESMGELRSGDLSYCDKIPVKHFSSAAGVRVVPPAVARYGAYVERGAILMPSYVNIGARVGAGTLVDTWATVGSCAQIGREVHLSGGVGIGGVLEPLQAQPVIIEDGCFIGSRCVVVEGAHIGREAVLGANVVITSSTHIIDVSGPEAQEYRGYVPPRSVVIPGVRNRRFAAGEYGVPCALIIGQRQESTDRKTSLNAALRLVEQ